jgi:hypothetical protein
MINVIPEAQFPDYPLIQADSQLSPLTLQQCRDINQTIDGSRLHYPYDYLMQQLVKQA